MALLSNHPRPSSGRLLENIMTTLSFLLPIIVCTLMVQLRHLSGPLFQSLDHGWVQSWINNCRYEGVEVNPDPGNPATRNQAFNFSGTGIDEKTACTTFLRCLLFQATADYPSYWSSAASILGFIPTIVGLLSNSIEEVVAIADESPILALLLALSSTASFTSRFTTSQQPDIFEHHPNYILSAQKAVIDSVAKSILDNGRSRTNRWFLNQDFHMAGAVIALLGCTGGIWYWVWTLTRYGCVVWACPVKFHISLWVALSQVLVVLNIAFRSWLFRTESITLYIQEGRAVQITRESTPDVYHIGPRRMPTLETQELLSTGRVRVRIIVLRCPRHDWKRWVAQTASSITSYALYTFATVVLASMILIFPVTAVYTMVTFGITGGIGRLVGYWAGGPLRMGKAIIVFDVPEIHMKDLRERLENEVNWQTSDIELTDIHVVK